MSYTTLSSIDLGTCSKAQLKAFVKLAREEWGKAIDLRSADIHSLIEYLTMYLQFKAEAEKAVLQVEPEFIGFDTEGVDVTGFVRKDGLRLDQTMTPVSCDISRYPKCDLPETPVNAIAAYQYRGNKGYVNLEEIKKPRNYSEHVGRAIAILLEFGTAYGDKFTPDWVAGIMDDCRRRESHSGELAEKLILSDPLFFGLAGRSPEEVREMRLRIKRPGDESIAKDCFCRIIHENIKYYSLIS